MCSTSNLQQLEGLHGLDLLMESFQIFSFDPPSDSFFSEDVVEDGVGGS